MNELDFWHEDIDSGNVKMACKLLDERDQRCSRSIRYRGSEIKSAISQEQLSQSALFFTCLYRLNLLKKGI